MAIFDTHAHYDSGGFNADRHDVLPALPEGNVALVVNPGCDLPSSRTAVELAERYPYVYAAVGIHPSDCAGTGEAEYEALRELAKHEKVVAIGEIGLDYYWEDNPPKEFQQQVLRRQIELALELDLPVIIHDREAHGDSLAIVLEYPALRGVFHCFSGSPEMAEELLRAQAPVPPELEGGNTSYWYVCGECHGVVDTRDAYCKHCGRKIMW